MLRLGQLACVLSLFAICGGHWAVLQTVAWAQMLRDYSQESGLVLAIQQTFSGERPCTMCVTITNERQQESQSPTSLSLAKKFEILLAIGFISALQPIARKFAYPRTADLLPDLLTDSPPTPVPRSVVS